MGCGMYDIWPTYYPKIEQCMHKNQPSHSHNAKVETKLNHPDHTGFAVFTYCDIRLMTRSTQVIVGRVTILDMPG